MAQLVFYIIGLLLLGGSPAWGATEVSLYGGYAHTVNGNARVVIGSDVAADSVQLGHSAEVGGRVTYWLPVYNLGVALDMSVFTPDPSFTRSIFVTPLLLVKYDLKYLAQDWADLSKYGIRLYAGAGPSVVHAGLRVPVTVEQTICTASGKKGQCLETETNVVESTFKDEANALGVKALAGMSAPLLTGRYGIVRVFGEYSFTHTRPTFTRRVFDEAITAEVTINTHHVVGGLAYEF